MEDNWRKEEKLGWLRNNPIEKIHFTHIIPDKNNNWINLSEDNDWDEYIGIKQIFTLSAPGVNTARDEWIFDLSCDNLKSKTKFLIEEYNKSITSNAIEYTNTIKWSSSLKSHFMKQKRLNAFNRDTIKEFLYRPFYKTNFYSDKMLSDRLTANHYDFFGNMLTNVNRVFQFNSAGGCQKPFSILSSQYLAPFQFFTDPTQCIPLYSYDATGKRHDNITDWGLEQFVSHYEDKAITKEDIFHYTYAVLHDPSYRKKYEINLKREYPRLPFYENFRQWADWGKKLMELHINYEQVEPYKLEIIESGTKAESKRQKEFFSMVKEPETLYGYKPSVKAKLRADKETGIIEIDELTFLKGVPKSAWDYKLGNRSALEWVLDQYKEKKPSDPTIAEKFNTYRFADYKDHVIDLLKRVCTVSVETMKIVEEMGKEK